MEVREDSFNRQSPPRARDGGDPNSGETVVSGLTMTTIAADIEEAMLFTCMSNDNNERSKGDHTINNPPFFGRQSSHVPLSPDGSFASLEESSSSDSDISLDRSSRPIAHRRHRAPSAAAKADASAALTSTGASATTGIEVEVADGECSTISSVASLFFGQEGPCSLHLDGATNDGTIREVTRRHAPGTCTAAAPMLTSATSSSSSHNSLKENPPPRLQNLAIAAPGAVPMIRKSSLKPIGSCGSSLASSSNISKEVKFDNVKIREYNISLSQNPSCSEGPPVELGWQFREPPPVNLQEYELQRKPFRRRSLHDLILSDSVRRRMLLQTYSPREITEAIRNVEQLKRQRIVTYMMLPAAAIDEAAEEMYDYMSKVFK